MNICTQCGARLPESESCADRFSASQLMEIEQPAYYAVHHLSVPCYYLQHNLYSRQGWLAARELLSRFVYQNLKPEEARRQGRREADSGKRNWSFTKGEKLAGVEKIRWRFSIADISLESADKYCADIRQWAVSILADSDALVSSL